MTLQLCWRRTTQYSLELGKNHSLIRFPIEMSFIIQRVIFSLALILASTITVDLEKTVEFQKYSIDPAHDRVARAAKDPPAADSPEGRGFGDGSDDDLAEARSFRDQAFANNDDDFGDDPAHDPFAQSIKWAYFVKNAEVIIAKAKAIIKNLENSLTATTPGLAGDKKRFLANFTKNFGELFRALPEFFEPLHEQLIDSAAYTKVDPAIGLTTIRLLNELAKSKPSRVLDKTRLKWIEINAMAITIHHVFDRMYDLFDGYGLGEIDRAIQIEYPSWLVKNAHNESHDLFSVMNPDQIIEHIHEELIGLGEKDHLFRGLERILRKRLTKIHPSLTDYNYYCYGNNEFGIIHDSFDLLTDAALFLLMADLKYSALQVVHQVHLLWTSMHSHSKSAVLHDVNKHVENIFKKLDHRADRKLKIAPTLAQLPPHVIVPGPTTFKCDLAPKPHDPSKGPIITSDLFPPGVYIQNNTAFTPDHQPLKTDVHGIPVMPDGTRLSAELRPLWVGLDGLRLTYLVRVNDKGEPIGENNAVVPAKRIYILIPVDSKTPKLANPDYPMTEWGIPPPQGLSPKSNGLDPPLDPQTGPDTNKGFIDRRRPNFFAGQFDKAYAGYLEAEQVLNPDGSCSGTCADYFRPTPTCNNKTDHCESFRKSVCEPGKNCLAKSNCPTKAKRCIKTGRDVSFCVSSGNTSLYDWIKVNGKHVGVPDEIQTGVPGEHQSNFAKAEEARGICTHDIQKTKERWEMEFGIILNAPQYCEVCLCVCDDPLSDEGFQYFNTEAVHVTAGYVVTAVKFERTHHTIRLKVEEGKLIGDGAVDPATTKWIEKEVNKEKNVQLSNSGFRKMNLDVVYGLHHEVVTGIRFKHEGNSLSLEVQFTKLTKLGVFDASPVAEWRSANYPHPKAPRRVIDLTGLHNPSHQRGPSQPWHVPDNSWAAEFDASDLTKDSGNSVIPWFDLQSVHHYSGKKGLASIGILYKSKQGSGGFLSPAISIYRKSYV